MNVHENDISNVDSVFESTNITVFWATIFMLRIFSSLFDFESLIIIKEPWDLCRPLYIENSVYILKLDVKMAPEMSGFFDWLPLNIRMLESAETDWKKFKSTWPIWRHFLKQNILNTWKFSFSEINQKYGSTNSERILTERFVDLPSIHDQNSTQRIFNHENFQNETKIH